MGFRLKPERFRRVMPFAMLRSLSWLFLMGCAFGAAAQSYPAREIRVVLPYPISGPTDIRGTSRVTKTYKLIAAHAPPAISDSLGRLVQLSLQSDSKFPVTLERQPGAATARGAQRVAQAAADGHTLLLASNATMVLLPHYVAGLGYDPMRDFELVAPLAEMPFVLMMSAGLPVQSLDKLIAYIKMRPGEVNYGSSGEGSTGHLAGELLRRAAGLDMVHVSYNGGLAALNGVAMGQTSLMFAALPLALPYRHDPQLRTLAIAAARRSPLVPTLPTFQEWGIRGMEVTAWFGVFGPNGMPTSIIRRLSERIGEVLNEPASQQDLARLGLEPARGPLSEFATRIYAEGERWGPVLKAARLPARNT